MLYPITNMTLSLWQSQLANTYLAVLLLGVPVFPVYTTPLMTCLIKINRINYCKLFIIFLMLTQKFLIHLHSVHAQQHQWPSWQVHRYRLEQFLNNFVEHVNSMTSNEWTFYAYFTIDLCYIEKIFCTVTLYHNYTVCADYTSLI